MRASTPGPIPSSVRRSAAGLCLLVAALLAAVAQAGAQQRVSAAEFTDAFDALDAYVMQRLMFARATGNAEMLEAFRMQRERGLISDEQYEEAVRSFGGAGLRQRGRPFTGVVYDDSGDARGAFDRVEARFEEGRLLGAVYWRADHRTREIVVEDDTIRETSYWGPPFAGEERHEAVYANEYGDEVSSRDWSPDGELIREAGPDGELRPGPGWMGGLNMWDADNAFYRSIERCEPAKLAVIDVYYAVAGPRAGGCAVEMAIWQASRSGQAHWAGEELVCIFRGRRSAYDFIQALSRFEPPTDACEGRLAELMAGESTGES